MRQDRDLIFPTFAVHRLPPGLGGGILAALLAAAMSSIDSGINSIATVLSVEIQKDDRTKADRDRAAGRNGEHVVMAKAITLVAGLLITIAAYGLQFLPSDWGIVDALPRTFNAITAPLGGFFLVGMFLPFVGGRAAVAGTICGLATSVGIGYYSNICELLVDLSLLSYVPEPLSFTWIMPGALFVTVASSAFFGLFEGTSDRNLAGLTWARRNEPSTLTEKIHEDDDGD